MRGKRILITGASRGLGRAVALAAGAKNATVGLNYWHSEDAALEIAKLQPDNVTLLKADIRDYEAVHTMVRDFVAKHGGVDVLVNNAAVHHPALVLKKSSHLIRDEIETNLLGAVAACHAVIPYMVRQEKGLILSISSIAVNQLRPGLAVYTASKAGLEAFTRSVALEYRSRGIRALTVRFGPILTDMFEQLPQQEAEQVLSRVAHRKAIPVMEAAESISDLIENKLELQTGSVITIDDGYSLGH